MAWFVELSVDRVTVLGGNQVSSPETRTVVPLLVAAQARAGRLTNQPLDRLP